VTAELENVIRIHPRIKGFQILNDNGLHLISGYQRRWIPYTKARRDSVTRLFRAWRSASNSSPVEGVEVATKRHVNPKTRCRYTFLETTTSDRPKTRSSTHSLG